MEIAVILLMAIVASIIFAVVKSREKRAEEAARYRQHIVDTYGKALGLKFRQLVVRDEYGHANNDRWEREKTYFIRNALGMRIPTKNEIGRHAFNYNATRALIDNIGSD
jgi:hypothetical protein